MKREMGVSLISMACIDIAYTISLPQSLPQSSLSDTLAYPFYPPLYIATLIN
jgi:hypothetical protein